jgi:hypothetical protein
MRQAMIHKYLKGLCTVLAICLSCFTILAVASELGSQAEARQTLSNEYTQIVDKAFPKYDGEMLKMKFESTAKKYPEGLDTIRVRKLPDIEKQLKLKPMQHETGATMYKGDGILYEVNPEMGKIRFRQEILKPMALSKTMARQVLPKVTKQHEMLIKNMGVTKEQIFFMKTSLLMSQGTTDPKMGQEKKTDPVVTGVTTHVVRALDGIIVEGSGAQVTSFTTDKINSVRIDWPRIQFHPRIMSYELKSQESIKEAISNRVKEVAKGEKASVKMAVVLLPIMEEGKSYMVPVMKVGVRTENGGAGLIFYENLLAQEVQIEKPRTDEASGGNQR